MTSFRQAIELVAHSFLFLLVQKSSSVIEQETPEL